MDNIGIYVVSFFLVASNLFWAMLTLKLVNKLMSRSYYEYVQAQKLKRSGDVGFRDNTADVIDPVDEKQAQEINSLLGIV